MNHVTGSGSVDDYCQPTPALRVGSNLRASRTLRLRADHVASAALLRSGYSPSATAPELRTSSKVRSQSTALIGVSF
jgi:hypothetical protein